MERGDGQGRPPGILPPLPPGEKRKKKGKGRGRKGFKVAYTNRKSTKDLRNNNNTNELSLTKEDLSFMSEEEKLLLSSWGLPPPVLERYKSKGITSLFPWQLECLSNPKVLDGKNLVYSAPTSAGKTLVAEVLMLKRVLELGKKALLILPFVSVCREKMYSLQDLFSPSGVRVDGFMGSYNPPGGFKATDIAICTIEKANSLINRLLEDNSLSDLGTIVVDELHLIGDQHRGYLLELLLTKIKFMTQQQQDQRNSQHSQSNSQNQSVDNSKRVQIQIIGMSATLPNLDLLSSWLCAELVVSEHRPVPLLEKIAFSDGLVYDTSLNLKRDLNTAMHPGLPFSSVIGEERYLSFLCLETLLSGHSILIFCHTKAKCEKVAEQIARDFFSIGTNKGGNVPTEMTLRVREELKSAGIVEVLTQLEMCPGGLEPVLKSTVSFGVAFHHAGLTLEERDIIEASFKRGVLRVIVATSTLSAGVNLPARRVVVHSPIVYNQQMLDVMTYRQMCGRAGRKGVDTEGESILLCGGGPMKEAGLRLLRSTLPLVKSGLEAHSLKRALLEVIASGVAKKRKDVEAYATFTLLSKSVQAGLMEKEKGVDEDSCDETDPDAKDPLASSLAFLRDNEFIRVQEYEAEGRESEWVGTLLGTATLASSLSPEDGIKVYKELQKARKGFVLETELHIVYQVTPMYLSDQMNNIPWLHFQKLYSELPPIERRVGNLVGIDEAFLVRAMVGSATFKNPKQLPKYMIHQRFYAALALKDLVMEMPISEVAEKYGLNKGIIQNLQQAASTFAGMVTIFCAKLGWSNLELLLGQFQERLQFGVQRELIDLVKLSTMNGQRARVLYNSGIKTVADLAATDPAVIEQIFYKSSPFKSKVHGTVDLVEATNTVKKHWMVGKQDGLTEGEAAKKIVEEARQFIQVELRLAPESLNFLKKDDPQRNSPADTISSSSGEDNDEDEDGDADTEEISPKKKQKPNKNHPNKTTNSKKKPQQIMAFSQSQPSRPAAIVTSSQPTEPSIIEVEVISLISPNPIASSTRTSNSRNSNGNGNNEPQNQQSVQQMSFREREASLPLPLMHTSNGPGFGDISCFDIFEDSFPDASAFAQGDWGGGIDQNQPDPSVKKRGRDQAQGQDLSASIVEEIVENAMDISEILEEVGNDSDCICSSPPKKFPKTKRGIRTPTSNSSTPGGRRITPNSAAARQSPRGQGQGQGAIMTSTPKSSFNFGPENNDDLELIIAGLEAEQRAANANSTNAAKKDSYQLSNSDVRAMEAIAENNLNDSQQDMFPEMFDVSIFERELEKERQGSEDMFADFETEGKGHNNNRPEDSSGSQSVVTSADSAFLSEVRSNSHNSHAPSSEGLHIPQIRPLGEHKVKLISFTSDLPESFFTSSKTLSLSFRISTPTNPQQQLDQEQQPPKIGARVTKGRKKGVKEILPEEVFLTSKVITFALFDGGNTIYIYQQRDRKSETNAATNTKFRANISEVFDRIDNMDNSVFRNVVMFNAKERLEELLEFFGELFFSQIRILDPKMAQWMVQEDDEVPRQDKMADLYCHSTEEEKKNYRTFSREIHSNAVEPWVAMKAMQKLEEILKERMLWQPFVETEMPSIFPILFMELNGLGVDTKSLEEIHSELEYKSALLQIKAFQVVGRQFNIGSNKELKQILYREQGLQEPQGMKGLAKDVLAKIHKKSGHILPQIILDYRKVDQALSIVKLFLERQLRASAFPPRARGRYNNFTQTGRINMFEPSLQTIPRDFELLTEKGDTPPNVILQLAKKFCQNMPSLIQRIEEYCKKNSNTNSRDKRDDQAKQISIRSAFTPSRTEDFVLVAADYSQLELRILAHLSKDQALIKILNKDGGDVFKNIAAKWKGMREDKVSAVLRQEAKGIVYGVIYGMSCRTLSEQLGVGESVASAFRNQFMRSYPGVQEYFEKTIAACRERGYIQTLLGRRRYLPNITSDDQTDKAQAERQAFNSQIQGSAADLVKMAMNKIYNALGAAYPSSATPIDWRNFPGNPPIICFPVLNLHDELIFEVKMSHLESVTDLIRKEMEECMALRVKIPVVIKTGKSWGTLEVMKK